MLSYGPGLRWDRMDKHHTARRGIALRPNEDGARETRGSGLSVGRPSVTDVRLGGRIPEMLSFVFIVMYAIWIRRERQRQRQRERESSPESTVFCAPRVQNYAHARPIFPPDWNAWEISSFCIKQPNKPGSIMKSKAWGCLE